MQTSFVAVAAGSDFSLQNLPYGVFSTAVSPRPRVGVALGDWVVDLAVLEAHGLLPTQDCFDQPALNRFMARGTAVWRETRARLQQLLDENTPTLRDDAALRRQALVPRQQAIMHLPAHIGDYTDFYASRQHATNVGKMFRDPENALLPNWRHLPVGYHGRASSIVVSGTAVARPWGQLGEGVFAPSQRMDFELELGAFIGTGNPLGQAIPLAEAEAHLFGLVLLNDWSARDIQKWEYVPLGPFLGKSVATTISPWVVPLDALRPFLVDGERQTPEPLPYLRHSAEQKTAYDLTLEAAVQGEVVGRTNARNLYWSLAQMVAHHSSNGCNLRPGDLFGTGTISGTMAGSYGSLLELTWGGARPLTLADGSTRAFLNDGDEVVLRGYAQGAGYRVGFGVARGRISPARSGT